MTPMEELKRMFEDETQRNKDWQEKHDREAFAFRTELLGEIQPFKEFRMSLTWFWKIVLGVSGLVWSVIKGWAWLKEHVK